MTEPLPIEALPDDLDAQIKNKLAPGESIVLCLKGAYKEFLICTNQRLMIAKEGLMTGQFLGSHVFELAHAHIGGIKVEYGMLSGYVEVTPVGSESTPMSFWSTDEKHDPAKAPNCISLDDGGRAKLFRAAQAAIMQQIEISKRPPTAFAASAVPAEDMADRLEKLWKLKAEGAINEAEYAEAKARVMAGL